MDLQMTPAQQDLRAELRAWLVTNLPWEYGTEPPTRSQDLAEVVAFGRRWQSMLAGGRWVGVTWPEELGGRGLGATEHFLVTEEMARARAPELVGRIGINLVSVGDLPSSGPRSSGASSSASRRPVVTWPP
jgi:alkylation response protein AidB-like acyl-CoA dehydrogenase